MSGTLPSGPKFSARSPIVWALLVVIASFLGSMWVSHARTSGIDSRVQTIARSAAPAISRLASMREDLRHLETAASDYASEPTAREAKVAAARHQLVADLAAYRALPLTSATVDLAPVLDRLPELDDAVAGVLAIERSDMPPSPQRAIDDRLHAAIEEVDDGVETEQQRTIQVAEDRAIEIAGLRRHGRDAAVLLGGLSVVAALVAGSFAFLVMRRQARLVAAHGKLLEERARELEAFAGRVAHDLRNPLNALVLRIETLRMRDAAERDALDKLSTQAKRMDKVIDGMLDFARAGAHPDADARADLRETLDGVVADTRPAIDGAHAELRIAPLPPTPVACSPTALTSILSNLIANAAKYIVDVPAERRTITVAAAPRDGRVHVDVVDTGPGLPPGTSPELLFQPFQRGGDKRHSGIGLGLATVKRLVEAHAGRVGVTSTPGRGCTFWFELPAAV